MFLDVIFIFKAALQNKKTKQLAHLQPADTTIKKNHSLGYHCQSRHN
jgi:hypothetical protein